MNVFIDKNTKFIETFWKKQSTKCFKTLDIHQTEFMQKMEREI